MLLFFCKGNWIFNEKYQPHSPVYNVISDELSRFPKSQGGGDLKIQNFWITPLFAFQKFRNPENWKSDSLEIQKISLFLHARGGGVVRKMPVHHLHFQPVGGIQVETSVI